MKGKLLYAAALMLLLCACAGGAKVKGDGSSQEDSVKKDDCNSVYAQIIGVNGDRLTVRAEENVLALEVDKNLLIDWKTDEDIILYYTGKFGDAMQVHYVEKWTENSEVSKPDKKKGSGSGDEGGVIG